MTMTVQEAAEFLNTDVQTFIINAMDRFDEAETWEADTQLPEEMIEKLSISAEQYKSASTPKQSVGAGSNFNGSLVKATGDALESTHQCAEALKFAFHELDPVELEQWVAAAAIQAANKIEVFESVEAHVLGEWHQGRTTRATADLEKCLGKNQAEVEKILKRHGINSASETLGNSQRHQAAMQGRTAEILKQVLAVSRLTK